jgi:CelD/BcsL family acetyltransferase involved in cellulose biosynthesis
MEIRYHRDFNEINEAEWNALLQSNSTNVPFLKYSYLKRWWQFKGGGEWPDSELVLISGRREGRLVGIAPLFIATHELKKKILLLGSIEISDYLDLIIEPPYAEEFISNVLDSLNDRFPDIRISCFTIFPKNLQPCPSWKRMLAATAGLSNPRKPIPPRSSNFPGLGDLSGKHR